MLKFCIMYVVFFIVAYVVYYFFVTNGQIKSIRGKSKKKHELTPELNLLKKYYHIDIEKIGYIKVLKIVNFLNAFLITSLTMSVYYIKQIWLKGIILIVAILPVIWIGYYFLAKYLKYKERKIDNV